jgi:hypothetical protein
MNKAIKKKIDELAKLTDDKKAIDGKIKKLKKELSKNITEDTVLKGYKYQIKIKFPQVTDFTKDFKKKLFKILGSKDFIRLANFKVTELKKELSKKDQNRIFFTEEAENPRFQKISPLED